MVGGEGREKKGRGGGELEGRKGVEGERGGERYILCRKGEKGVRGGGEDRGEVGRRSGEGKIRQKRFV